jgi:hypothetical protein
MIGNNKKIIIALLISIFSIKRFRLILIRWIIYINIYLSIIEDTSFINLILSVNLGLNKYLVKSYITIRR